MKKTALALALVSVSLVSTPINAATLELALLIDGSGSVSSTDFGLQLNAYQNVFTNPAFFSTFVAPSEFDSIVVSAYQFGTRVSGGVTQEIPFTVINDQASATAFGSLFTFSQGNGGTPMANAIEAATDGILNNGFGGAPGDVSVIDISTDGSPNSQFATQNAAEDAETAGIDSLNALAVGPFANESFLETIVFGPGFVETADTFNDFQEALENKLEIEIGGGGNGTPVPEPASVISLFAFLTLGAASGLKRKLA